MTASPPSGSSRGRGRVTFVPATPKSGRPAEAPARPEPMADAPGQQEGATAGNGQPSGGVADQVTTSPRPPSDRRAWPKWLASLPGGPLLLLRAFLGVTFTFAGLQKLANPNFLNARSPTSIQAQLQGSVHSTPFGSLLSPLLHFAVPLAIIIALAEVAVGLGTLLGLYARVAAVGGALLALMFFLTVSFNDSPYYYGPDIVFFFAWSPLVIGGAGALSLDGYFARQRAARAGARRRGGPRVARLRDDAVDRRVAVRKLSTAGLVGAVVVILAGFTAALGRMFAKTTTTNTSSLGGSGKSGSTPTTGGAGSGSGTPAGTGSGSGGSAKVPGKLLGKTSQVPIGGAASFGDPYQQNAPGYVVQPHEGEFLAFSAICTHAGCTVQFAKAQQQFQCPCHGSVYSALTGQVLGGPAPSPLPQIKIKVANGDIYVED